MSSVNIHELFKNADGADSGGMGGLGSLLGGSGGGKGGSGGGSVKSSSTSTSDPVSAFVVEATKQMGQTTRQMYDYGFQFISGQVKSAKEKANAQNDQIRAQTDKIRAEISRLEQDKRASLLNDAQKYDLAVMTLTAKTEQERKQMIEDNLTQVSLGALSGISAYKVAQAQAAAQAKQSQTNNFLILVGVSSALLLVAAIFIKPKD